MVGVTLHLITKLFAISFFQMLTVIRVVAEIVVRMPTYVVIVSIMRTRWAHTRARTPLVYIGAARIGVHFGFLNAYVFRFSVVAFLSRWQLVVVFPWGSWFWNENLWNKLMLVANLDSWSVFICLVNFKIIREDKLINCHYLLASKETRPRRTTDVKRHACSQ